MTIDLHGISGLAFVIAYLRRWSEWPFSAQLHIGGLTSDDSKKGCLFNEEEGALPSSRI